MNENNYCATGDFKVWIRDTIKYKAWETLILKIFFGDAEYCEHDFYVSYKKHHQTHENTFMPKQQKNYTSKGYMYTYDLP